MSSPGISITISRRFPVPVFLLGTILAGVPAPSAGSTPVEQQAVESIDYVAGVVRSADSGTPLAGAMVIVVTTGGSAITHGDRSFRIAVPDAERYRLRIDHLGYAAVAVDVRPGEMAAVDLEVAAVPLPNVVVTAVLSPTAANETIRPSAVREPRDGSSWIAIITGGAVGTYEEVGHYVGMMVAADGRFHPVWVDNRTGVAQLYTAPVEVAGTARTRAEC